ALDAAEAVFHLQDEDALPANPRRRRKGATGRVELVDLFPLPLDGDGLGLTQGRFSGRGLRHGQESQTSCPRSLRPDPWPWHMDCFQRQRKRSPAHPSPTQHMPKKFHLGWFTNFALDQWNEPFSS